MRSSHMAASCGGCVNPLRDVCVDAIKEARLNYNATYGAEYTMRNALKNLAVRDPSERFDRLDNGETALCVCGKHLNCE